MRSGVFLMNFGVKYGQTLSSVFDISSRTKLKLRRKRSNKIVQICANLDQIAKHRHDHDFLSLNLMNYP